MTLIRIALVTLISFIQEKFCGKENDPYTVYHPLVVDVFCVRFRDYARLLGPKQMTRNIYHKRMIIYGVLTNYSNLYH